MEQWNRSAPLPVNGNLKTSFDIGERIRAAAEEDEKRWQDKLARSRESDVDVRSFFTDEELARLLSGAESFSGKVADLSKLDRYNRACTMANWLEQHSMEVLNLEIEGTAKDRPNAIIVMDFRRICSLRDKELRMFNGLVELSDSMYMSGLKENCIRVTFAVEGIWKE